MPTTRPKDLEERLATLDAIRHRIQEAGAAVDRAQRAVHRAVGDAEKRAVLDELHPPGGAGITVHAKGRWMHGGPHAILFLDNGAIEILTGPLGAPALTPAEEETLVAGGVSKEALSRGPQLRALVQRQTDSAYARLLSLALDVNEAAKVLGVNPSRIRQRLDDGTLYGIKSGHTWRLPRFQFVGGRTLKGTVPHIEEVLCVLPKGLSPLAVDQWFATPNPDLSTPDEDERPMTPLEWLSRGQSPDVLAEVAARL